jgi:hypothetical protein
MSSKLPTDGIRQDRHILAQERHVLLKTLLKLCRALG